MIIEVQNLQNGWIKVSPIGSFDGDVELASFQKELNNLVEQGQNKIIIDMTSVRMINSVAIGSIIWLYKRVHGLEDNRVAIANLNDFNRRMIEFARLDEIITIIDRLEDFSFD